MPGAVSRSWRASSSRRARRSGRTACVQRIKQADQDEGRAAPRPAPAAGAGTVLSAAERDELTRLRRENLDGDEVKVARRLVGMLARRGYNEAMCFDVVKTELALELERRRT